MLSVRPVRVPWRSRILRPSQAPRNCNPDQICITARFSCRKPRQGQPRPSLDSRQRAHSKHRMPRIKVPIEDNGPCGFPRAKTQRMPLIYCSCVPFCDALSVQCRTDFSRNSQRRLRLNQWPDHRSVFALILCRAHSFWVCLNLYVELDGDEIVVTRPGTEMMTAYRKTSDRPNLVLKDGSPNGTSVAGLLGPVPAS